jgi:hypothetical protein
MRVAEKVGKFAAPYLSATGKVLNPALALGGAGYAGADVYNRIQSGDFPGAAISSVGGLGSLATLAPHPLVKGAGAGVSAGAEAINAYRDKVRRGEIVHGAPEYTNYDPTGATYAQGGLAHLAEGGQSNTIEDLLKSIKDPSKQLVVPAPNRWFSEPEKFPHVQRMIEKVLETSGQPREAFYSGAFIDPRTGEVLDKRVYNNAGVLVDPITNKPLMSVGSENNHGST